jgi:hypothetical protein
MAKLRDMKATITPPAIRLPIIANFLSFVNKIIDI